MNKRRRLDDDVGSDSESYASDSHDELSVNEDEEELPIVEYSQLVRVVVDENDTVRPRDVPENLKILYGNWSGKGRKERRFVYKLDERKGHRLPFRHNTLGSMRRSLLKLVVPHGLLFMYEWCPVQVAYALARQYNCTDLIESLGTRIATRSELWNENGDAMKKKWFETNRYAHRVSPLFDSVPSMKYNISDNISNEALLYHKSDMYLLWTNMFMYDYYGSCISMNANPYQNLLNVYNSIVDVDIRKRDNTVRAGLETLLGYENVDATPFLSNMGVYNVPFELCLPPELVYKLRTFVEMNSETVMFENADEYIFNTSQFHEWYMNQSLRKFNPDLRSKPRWLYTLDGLLPGAGSVGLLREYWKVTKHTKEPKSCYFPDAIKSFTELYESRAMHVLHENLVHEGYTICAYRDNSFVVTKRVYHEQDVLALKNDINDELYDKRLYMNVVVGRVDNNPTLTRIDESDLAPEQYLNIRDPPPEADTVDEQQDAYVQYCIHLLQMWAKKHGAWRDMNRSAKTFRVWHRVGDTKAYTHRFKLDGGSVHDIVNIDTFLNHAISEMNNTWYEDVFTNPLIRPQRVEQIRQWLLYTQCKNYFPLRPDSAKNRLTILAYKYGWVLAYKIKEAGMEGLELKDLELSDVYVPYTENCIDPDTDQEPICIDTTRVGIDFEVEVWPNLVADDLARCPILSATLVRQIDAYAVNGNFADEKKQQLDVIMGYMGGLACPGEEPQRLISIVEGPQGTGKSTCIDILKFHLGPDESAIVQNSKNDDNVFADSVMVNFSTGRCKNLLFVPDLQTFKLLQVVPQAKQIATGEPVSMQTKGDKEQTTFNMYVWGQETATGLRHDYGPGGIIVCINDIYAAGLTEEGMSRRILPWRFLAVPDQADDGLKTIVRKTYHHEILYCIHRFGRIKNLMQTPRDDGSTPGLRDIYPDATGNGIVKRMSDAFYNSIYSGGEESHAYLWVKQHVITKKGWYLSGKKLFDSYKKTCRDDHIPVPTKVAEFYRVCKMAGLKEHSSSHGNEISVCEGSISETKLAAEHLYRVDCCSKSKRTRGAMFANCVFSN